MLLRKFMSFGYACSPEDPPPLSQLKSLVFLMNQKAFNLTVLRACIKRATSYNGLIVLIYNVKTVCYDIFWFAYKKYVVKIIVSKYVVFV